jgi:hypothetical protein
MPVTIPYPYFELGLDASGHPTDAGQLPALIAGLRAKATTDLFLISHGWNDDQQGAHELYQELFTNVKGQEQNVDVAGRSFAVAGVIWPSKTFDTAEDPPNAAAIGDGHARVARQIDTLEAFLASGAGAAKHRTDLNRAKTLIPKLELDAAARREFSQIVLARLPATVGQEGDRHISARVGGDMIANDTLLQQLGSPPPKVADHTGGAATMGHAPAGSGSSFQGAAGIGDFLHGVIAGASNLLNYVTYYQMKNRAGVVGRAGVNQALQQLRAELPNVRIHLVGHSFGCRVVTAAVTGDAHSSRGFADSMSLLQAAFSHYAFSGGYDDAKTPGFYRNLITESRVSGPVIITHTRADKAVGLAYAIASRAMHQIAAAMGDANDPYGGLGSNGAQKTAEAVDGTMPKAGMRFDRPLAKGTMTNLLADGLITSHSDVRNPNAAYSVLSASRVGGG